MKLQEHETRSTLWLKLEAHITAELEMLRRKNDGALTPEQTTHGRGRIAQCKAFLALARESGNEVATEEAAPATQSDPTGLGF